MKASSFCHFRVKSTCLQNQAQLADIPSNQTGWHTYTCMHIYTHTAPTYTHSCTRKHHGPPWVPTRLVIGIYLSLNWTISAWKIDQIDHHLGAWSFTMQLPVAVFGQWHFFYRWNLLRRPLSGDHSPMASSFNWHGWVCIQIRLDETTAATTVWRHQHACKCMVYRTACVTSTVFQHACMQIYVIHCIAHKPCCKMHAKMSPLIPKVPLI